MVSWLRPAIGALAILAVGVWCGPASNTVRDGSRIQTDPARQTVKRTVIAVEGEQGSSPTASGPASLMKRLIHSGLADPDGRGTNHARLAEAVPSLENGLWTLF